MRLELFKFTSDRNYKVVKLGPNERIKGRVTMPPGARIVHCGAAPPTGELAVWAEVGEIEVPKSEWLAVRLIILRAGDTIPREHEYRGYILANPMLFVYENTAPEIQLVRRGKRGDSETEEQLQEAEEDRGGGGRVPEAEGGDRPA